MRLLGAKEFLKIARPGDLFADIHLDFNNRKEYLKNIIHDYTTLTINDFSKKYGLSYYIYGDNSGSLNFSFNKNYNDNSIETEVINGKTYDCLFYFDYNIVGDASPSETLYILFEDEVEYPKKIKVEDLEDDSLVKEITNQEIPKIQKWFRENCGPFDDDSSEGSWPLKTLNEDYSEDIIVNYYLEDKIEKLSINTINGKLSEINMFGKKRK